jgi:small subunit ribosomal protein S6
MRAYETTFVMAPTLDTEGFQAEVDQLKKLIASHGGTITAEKEWGRRRLAFPIRDHSEGIYHILRFDYEPEGLPELDRWFKLNENVLRALVILDEGGSLDHVGQASESEERGYRDSRDRRGDRGGPRSSDRRPAESRDEKAPASEAPAEKEKPAEEEKPAEPVAATETAAPKTGGEESSE